MANIWNLSGNEMHLPCKRIRSSNVMATLEQEGRQFLFVFYQGQLSEAYSEPNQTSKTELSAKIANGQTSFTMFAKYYILDVLQRRGVVVNTTAKLRSTKSKFTFCASSNPVRGLLEICDGENL